MTGSMRPGGRAAKRPKAPAPMSASEVATVNDPAVEPGPADSDDPFGLLTPDDTAVASSTSTDDADDADATDADEEENATISRYSGVVVNRRITDDESALLFWMGFDVIRDSAAEFTEDLDHYTLHLEAGGRQAWPTASGECNLNFARATS